jgi:hypothetical protein
VPKSGRLNVDHFHTKGWKNMAPARRKLYVRGLVCYFCNRFFLARGATPEKLRNGAAYLEEWASRRPAVDANRGTGTPVTGVHSQNSDVNSNHEP